MARLLADAPLDVTVEFAFFGAEELGLVGSRTRARAAREAGEQIVFGTVVGPVGLQQLEVLPRTDTLHLESVKSQPNKLPADGQNVADRSTVTGRLSRSVPQSILYHWPLFGDGLSRRHRLGSVPYRA